MKAGALDQVITVQAKAMIKDPTTGYRTPAYTDRVVNEPAQWLAGPGGEYMAAGAVRARVTGRFNVRYSPDAAAIKASDRVLWDGRIMAVESPPLPDPTARDYLTIMVSESGTDGA